MRLHLNSAAPGADTVQGGAPGVAPGASLAPPGVASTTDTQRSSGGSQDSIVISGPSSAFSRLTTDRAARVEQVAASVRAGSYQIASSTLSSAIVAHATS